MRGYLDNRKVCASNRYTATRRTSPNFVEQPVPHSSHFCPRDIIVDSHPNFFEDWQTLTFSRGEISNTRGIFGNTQILRTAYKHNVYLFIKRGQCLIFSFSIVVEVFRVT